MFHEIDGIDTALCFCAPVLSWQAPLKNTKVKLDLLTDINISLMVQKGIRGGTCQAIY